MRRDSRETTVLASVIKAYTGTGEPVPSAVVASKSGLNLSPATIRAVMAELTVMGYLAQPHVSAGRVPTAKALRFYVDVVLTPRPLPRPQKDAITKALDLESADIPHILRRASGMVSSQCLQLGVVLAPRRDEMHWRTIEFSSISPSLVLAVLILDGGIVRTRMVPVSGEYTADELVRFGNYLNSSFKGCTLSEARRRIEDELALAGEQLEAMRRTALARSRPALDGLEEEREVFMDGIKTVSHSSEFADTARLRELLSFMEERPKLLDLLERTMREKDLSVSFIQGDYDASPWAVVSAPYTADEAGGPLGVVSAVGLPNMDYARILPIVAHIAGAVASAMRRRLAGG
ncbi:MAG: heat-inducible transcriptional repressor HrcA [Deltaproteobacteria bacterium]|jgi:heat-inducible transcriptional repressor|nr:heat-inducible transcriptional repressor HrcA [Deltaproteobacteria bacterium]